MSKPQRSSTEQNADVVRALYDAYNSRDFVRSASLVTEDYDGVVVPLGTKFRGTAGIKEFQLGWATAFPDSRVEIRTLTVDGDRVIVEHSGRGKIGRAHV